MRGVWVKLTTIGVVKELEQPDWKIGINTQNCQHIEISSEALASTGD
jgi:hypothetical protein